jgi:hypothetical protein
VVGDDCLAPARCSANVLGRLGEGQVGKAKEAIAMEVFPIFVSFLVLLLY